MIEEDVEMLEWFKDMISRMLGGNTNLIESFTAAMDNRTLPRFTFNTKHKWNKMFYFIYTKLWVYKKKVPTNNMYAEIEY